MKTRLTKSELAVMEVLWDEGEALTSAEIIQKSKEKEWKDSSVHLLINSLLKSVMLLRPLTCHIPVSPGLVARRAR